MRKTLGSKREGRLLEEMGLSSGNHKEHSIHSTGQKAQSWVSAALANAPRQRLTSSLPATRAAGGAARTQRGWRTSQPRSHQAVARRDKGGEGRTQRFRVRVTWPTAPCGTPACRTLCGHPSNAGDPPLSPPQPHHNPHPAPAARPLASASAFCRSAGACRRTCSAQGLAYTWTRLVSTSLPSPSRATSG